MKRSKTVTTNPSADAIVAFARDQAGELQTVSDRFTLYRDLMLLFGSLASDCMREEALITESIRDARRDALSVRRADRIVRS